MRSTYSGDLTHSAVFIMIMTPEHKWPNCVVAGLDEAGRGPLAGPVVAAAVILGDQVLIEGLADSKQLRPARREALSQLIKQHSLAWAIGSCSVEEIDQLNIFQASLLAMQRAYLGLSIKSDLALVDGNHTPQLPVRSEAIVKGDALIPEISAASILAKVERDQEMGRLHKQFPQYGFDRHKGYPTKAHIAALEQHGATECHRKTFAPVRKVIEGIQC